MDDSDEESKELGLSLSLQTYADTAIRDQELGDRDIREAGGYSLLESSKVQTNEMSAGITSQSINPANRKTRVSVRVRCQGPTVSSIYFR